MARPIKRIRRHSVSASSDGRLPQEARPKIEDAVRVNLSDEAWEKLGDRTFWYAINASGQLGADPGGDDQTASLAEAEYVADRIVVIAEELKRFVDTANAEKMDHLVTRRCADVWEQVYPHKLFAETNRMWMRVELANLLGSADLGSPDERADELLRDWEDRGYLPYADSAGDFVQLLGQFISAMKRVRSDLSLERGAPEVPAWDEYVCQLADWAKTFGVPFGRTHSEASEGGTAARLVSAINPWLPEQFRHSEMEPESLGKKISLALQKYEKTRPVRDNKSAVI